MLKLTLNVPVTARQRNPTLPWPDFNFNAKWDRRRPNPQHRWYCYKSAFALWQVRINNCIFFPIIPCPTPVGSRHKVIALALEGMRQSAIAGRMGLRHAATGTFVPGKSVGLLGKPHDTLLRTVQQDCFISAQALTAEVAGPDNGLLAACHLWWWVQIPT